MDPSKQYFHECRFPMPRSSHETYLLFSFYREAYSIQDQLTTLFIPEGKIMGFDCIL